MMVIYHCYGGTHTSPVAAAIHLGMLGEHTPSARQLFQLPFYDKVEPKDYGRLFYMGRDDMGRQIYILGMQNSKEIMGRSLPGVWQILGGDPQDLFLVDVFPCANWLMKIGGFLSRRVGLTVIGRPLVITGTRRAYKDIFQVVQSNRKKLQDAGR